MLKSSRARACRFYSRQPSPGAAHPAPRAEVGSLTRDGFGLWQAASTAPLRAVFAPNRPLNDSAFPESSGSPY